MESTIFSYKCACTAVFIVCMSNCPSFDGLSGMGGIGSTEPIQSSTGHRAGDALHGMLVHWHDHTYSGTMGTSSIRHMCLERQCADETSAPLGAHCISTVGAVC